MHDRIIWPAPGHYIVAVSGGADSMALLDLLVKAAPVRQYQLTAAHLDHGLRATSHHDRRLVERVGEQYGLTVVAAAAQLPPRASEAAARTARYQFLEQTRRSHQAAAIITAHHQDDLIETSLLNLARGSGRHGLAPLQRGLILRPLLNVSRQELRRYATTQQLSWHEDSTNTDLSNPRNFLRHQLLPHAPAGWTARYLAVIDQLHTANQAADHLLADLASVPAPGRLAFARTTLAALSLAETADLIHFAARRLHPGIELDSRLIQELALFAKTAHPGRRRPLRQNLQIFIQHKQIVLCKGQN